MSSEPPLILIIGAADTGRAPMAAALLRRMLQRRSLDWAVASAGVVGHDNAPAEPEARDAMAALNLDISSHQARSLSEELAATARVLVAIDSGVARVLVARRLAVPVVGLGDLAGRRRDIPDPFRMQVGAWLSYAREIEQLLGAGLDRLIAMIGDQAPPAAPQPPAPAEQPGPERLAAIERCLRILALLDELPDLIAWPNARQQIESSLQALAAPASAHDLAQPYTALLQAMLAMNQAPPSPGQRTRLRNAIARLHAAIAPADLEALSASLAGYAGCA
jgi:protein-tyrosine-phosphatase